jgi:hypothetical protein
MKKPAWRKTSWRRHINRGRRVTFAAGFGSINCAGYLAEVAKEARHL